VFDTNVSLLLKKLVVIQPDCSPLYHRLPLLFTANAGINVVAQSGESNMSFDLLYIPEFYQHLVDQTNPYTSQAVRAAPHPFTGYSLHQTWVPILVEEMKYFLCLTFFMGTIKNPKIKMYWTDDPAFGTPIFFKTNALQLI
jgi:hypothetical protein